MKTGKNIIELKFLKINIYKVDLNKLFILFILYFWKDMKKKIINHTLLKKT